MDEYIKRADAVDVIVKNPYNVAFKQIKVIKAIEDLPTANVVPKSEYDAVVSAVDNSTKEFLKLHDEYQSAEAEIERLKHILDCYALQYGTVTEQQRVIDKAKADAVSEIFAEIESAKVSIGDFKIKTFKIISLGKVAEQTITGDVVAFSDIAELKKKYTEGWDERSRSKRKRT